jgi:hypothetical protein
MLMEVQAVRREELPQLVELVGVEEQVQLV